VHYAYDATGQRVRKVVVDVHGVPRAERIYLGGYEIHRTYGANASTRETLHVMDDAQRIALVETRTAPTAEEPVVRYQIAGAVGSATIELDTAGALISYEEYHPYGTSAFQAGRNATEVALKRYRHTGKERDDETGFTYHGARYYAPWLGRWMSPDPAGIGAGLNLYEYCHGNPVNLRDDDGRDPTPDQVRFRQIYTERQRADASRAHAATLIEAFRDPGISGSTARDRFVAILNLTGGNPNAPSANFDTYTIRAIGTESPGGVGDTGFRRELRDSIQYRPDGMNRDVPMHRLSSDQVGHFLTAASFGFSLRDRDNYIAGQQRRQAEQRRAHPVLSFVGELVAGNIVLDQTLQYAFERQQYLSAMVGHELIRDRVASGLGISSTVMAPLMASAEDVSNFLRGRLDLIAVDDNLRGNSYQDLLLTWVGYTFGEHMANGDFRTSEDAAGWLSMMLTDQDLSAVPASHPFAADARQMRDMVQQFRQIQERIHPVAAQPTR
jgi:RHS repeat-associated protein